MKRLQTTVTMSRRFNLGDYNGLELSVTEVAEYDEGEDEQEVKSILRASIRKQFREEALLYPSVFKGQTQFLIAGVPVDMTPEMLLELQEKALHTATNGKR